MSIEVSHYIERRIINLLLFAMELKKEVPLTNVNFVLINQITRTIKSLEQIYKKAREKREGEEGTMEDVRKEAQDTRYWVRILKETNNSRFYKLIDELEDESEELIRIFSRIISMN
ncbi:MAG: hypothetical protein A3B44_03460 [Candidatus Levybacteria bacterium RIFCSPLOWO2_01_FULL_38_21]|nr:MAG: hypothetical protein A3B44_03460 [Candidatus Levybacteria bacterium RIFCSPLOWO2_01_FULL_38_21]